jgi:hypothetical protein
VRRYKRPAKEQIAFAIFDHYYDRRRFSHPRRFPILPLALLALRHANVLAATGHFRVTGHFLGSRRLMLVLVFGGSGSGAR